MGEHVSLRWSQHQAGGHSTHVCNVANSWNLRGSNINRKRLLDMLGTGLTTSNQFAHKSNFLNKGSINIRVKFRVTQSTSFVGEKVVKL